MESIVRFSRLLRSARWRPLFPLWLLRAVAACAGMGMAGAGGRAAEAVPAREYAVKAAFIYNFTKFVEWPAESFADANSPFVIGVFDAKPLYEELDKAVRGRRVNGREILVRHYDAPADVAAPHVLFVAGGEPAIRELRRRMAGQALLLVGDGEPFLGLGGTIAFVFEGDKLRFAIDMGSAARARLKISAQLQKLARTLRNPE